jgi:tRNA (cytidine/uridine-2'-O-)-methyltransferase
LKYAPLLHVVLHQPEIPPNTGNIGRSCVAIGAKLWLVKPLGFEISEKQVRRAGLDYWPHLEWEAVENWQELTAKLAEPLAAGRAWFFTKTATRSYTDVAYEKGDMLFLVPNQRVAGGDFGTTQGSGGARAHARGGAESQPVGCRGGGHV